MILLHSENCVKSIWDKNSEILEIQTMNDWSFKISLSVFSINYVINGYHSQKSEVIRYSRHWAHFEVDPKSETKKGIQRSLKVISENVTKLSLNIPSEP